MGKKSYKNSTRTWYIEGKLIKASNIQKLRKKKQIFGENCTKFQDSGYFFDDSRLIEKDTYVQSMRPSSNCDLNGIILTQ